MAIDQYIGCFKQVVFGAVNGWISVIWGELAVSAGWALAHNKVILAHHSLKHLYKAEWHS